MISFGEHVFNRVFTGVGVTELIFPTPGRESIPFTDMNGGKPSQRAHSLLLTVTAQLEIISPHMPLAQDPSPKEMENRDRSSL